MPLHAGSSTPAAATTSGSIPAAAVIIPAAAAAAVATAWMLLARHRAGSESTMSGGAAEELQRLQAALARQQFLRAEERVGRINALQQLQEVRLQLIQLAAAAPQDARAGEQQQQQQQQQQQPGQTPNSSSISSSSSSSVSQLQVYPLTPIGVLRSCFNYRCGTPRQPHLVPAARSVLQIVGAPPACLTGLDSFSHVWILYVFHENTDLGKVLTTRAAAAAAAAGGSSSCNGSGQHQQQLGYTNVKALIRVPRLNGNRMGVLATRSPHRPVPIGLSTARVLHVDAAAGRVVLGGVDIVDGSPVLDLKPYVPFSDALPDATAPAWVKASADEEEPLRLAGVTIGAEASAALVDAWHAANKIKQGCCTSPEHFLELVQQVLSRDIRSLHQRTNISPVLQHHGHRQQPDWSRDDVVNAQTQSYYVTLDSVCVRYSINAGSGAVTVEGAGQLEPAGSA